MHKTTLVSVTQLRADFADISFKSGETFYWSARDQTVYYDKTAVGTQKGLYRLFHELGHAVCRHQTFGSGVELLKLETDAWREASLIAKRYDLTIDVDHIEACLDSYRDWLYLRSTCPVCKAAGVETAPCNYRCFNCLTKWSVPVDQRRRCYRLTTPKLKTLP